MRRDSNHHPEHSQETHCKTQNTLSDRDKLVKIIEHWIHHNQEHSRSYKDWAHRAHRMGIQEVAVILEEVSKASEDQNQSLQNALSALKKGETSL